MATYTVGLGEDARTFDVSDQADGTIAVTTPSGQTLVIDAYRPEPGRLHMIVEDEAHDVDLRPRGDQGAWVVTLQGERHEVQVLTERQVRMQKAGVGGLRALSPELTSPMAGKVVKLHVAEGDEVSQGDPVVIVEAMKMENDLKAHVSGVVASVNAEVGQAVEIGDVLLVIEETE